MSPVEVVGWTLLHFLWQGTAVGLILFALLVVINRRRATTRYAVSLSALAIMACLPVATGFALYGRTADWSAQPGALSIVARPGESPQPRADATVSRQDSGERSLEEEKPQAPSTRTRTQNPDSEPETRLWTSPSSSTSRFSSTVSRRASA